MYQEYDPDFGLDDDTDGPPTLGCIIAALVYATAIGVLYGLYQIVAN